SETSGAPGDLAPEWSIRARRRVAFVAGAALTLAQYVLMRELPALLGTNEVVCLIVAVAYFGGLSVGYVVSDRVSRRPLLGITGAALALRASLPFSARLGMAALSEAHALAALIPLLFAFVFLGLAPLYAVFVPRLLASAEGEPAGGIVALYG